MFGQYVYILITLTLNATKVRLKCSRLRKLKVWVCILPR